MIRKAVSSDFLSCKGIAEVQAARYPHLRSNKDSIRRLFDECISGARNFALVSELNGIVVGCLFALSFDHIWAQKQASSILLWSCEKSGDGAGMLRRYRDWIDSRPAIRVGGFQSDIDIDKRTAALLTKNNFLISGGCFLRAKGG